MHSACFGYVARTVLELPPRRFVIDLGSLDVNGGIKQLFSGSTFLGIDIVPGPGVDVVADAAIYEPPLQPDTVLCLEVLEHAENAEAIVQNAHRMLAPGGVFIMTCATDGRAPHSAVDGGGLRDGEFYRNVSSQLAMTWLRCFGDVWDTPNPFPMDVDPVAGDLRVALRKSVEGLMPPLGKLRDLGRGERVSMRSER